MFKLSGGLFISRRVSDNDSTLGNGVPGDVTAGFGEVDSGAVHW